MHDMPPAEVETIKVSLSEQVKEIESVDEKSLKNFLKRRLHLKQKGILVLGPEGTNRHAQWMKDFSREFN